MGGFIRWAIDQLFGAGTADSFPEFVKSAVAKIVAANPSISEADVIQTATSDFNTMLAEVGAKVHVNAFALAIIESFADQALPALISSAYAALVPNPGTVEPQVAEAPAPVG